MVYCWKFLPGEVLTENEEQDIQVCFCESVLTSFLDRLHAISTSTDRLIGIQIAPLPINSPYHIDDPTANFYLPHKNYKLLTIVHSPGAQATVEENDTLQLYLNEYQIAELINTLKETRKSPSLYENKMALRTTQGIFRIVFWGSYKEKPIYF